MGEPGGLIEHRLAELGIDLPAPPMIRAGYLPGVISGSLLYLSGAVGTVPGPDGVEGLPIVGKLGVLSIAEGSYRYAADFFN